MNSRMDEALHDYGDGIRSEFLERPRKVVLREMQARKQDSLVHGFVNCCPRCVLFGRNRFSLEFRNTKQVLAFLFSLSQWGRGIRGSSGVARFLDNLTISAALINTCQSHKNHIRCGTCGVLYDLKGQRHAVFWFCDTRVV